MTPGSLSRAFRVGMAAACAVLWGEGSSGADWTVWRGNARLQGAAAGLSGGALVQRWRVEIGDTVCSPPVVAQGRVYVACSTNVFCLDLKSGAVLWRRAVDDAVEAAALVVGDRVYVPTLAGTLQALAAGDGGSLWQYRADAKIVGGANVCRPAGRRSPLVVFGAYDNRIHAVDAETGAAAWVYETDSYVNSTPATDHAVVVAGGCDALIHVMDAATGAPLRRIEAGAYITAAGALAGDRMFIGTYAGRFLCADIKAGTLVWEFGGEPPAMPFFASPAVAAGRVVAGCRDRNLYCFDGESGALRWRFAARGEVDASPVICGDRVVAGASDGRLYVLGLDDGALRQSLDLGSPIMGGAAVADGVVVVATEDGRVYAFRAEGE